MNRKMQYYKRIIIIPFLLICSSLQAQESTKILTFEEAIKVGLEQNIALRKNVNQLNALSMQETQSKIDFLPSVSANVQAARQGGQQFQLVEDGFEINNVQANRLSGNLSASVDIFRGLGRLNQIKMADLNYQAQRSAIERSKQQVVFDIAQQYLQLLLDKKLMEISSNAIQDQKNQLERIKGFVLTGLRPQADALAQKATLDQLELSFIETENTYLLDKARLAQTLQLDLLEDYEVSEAFGSASTSLEAYQLSELFELAIQNRSDLKQLDLQRQATDTNIDFLKSNYLPTLSAFYQYGTQYSSLNSLGISEQLFDLYPNNTVGLNLSIPLFSNYVNKSRVATAQVELANSRLDVEDLKRTIFQDVQNAYLNFNAAVKRVEVSESVLNSAQEAYKMQNERYAEGIANLSDLSIAQQALITAQANLEQAKFTLLFQQTILDFHTGVLQVETLNQ
ncbi:TolC family protein [Marivirga harenae]|uniref:TolC family protein n=2 Tax=Marivirga TaxID=869806 RepID=UPI0026E0685F|nr:TolC family protein [Marivirga harenae]WKV10586.1 TolC family protein [Marivirga harenae]|tara:strand:+ start:555148 stop:556506 length:1359 start_codon:yes stop_codon:yes gene_type:complete